MWKRTSFLEHNDYKPLKTFLFRPVQAGKQSVYMCTCLVYLMDAVRHKRASRGKKDPAPSLLLLQPSSCPREMDHSHFLTGSANFLIISTRITSFHQVSYCRPSFTISQNFTVLPNFQSCLEKYCLPFGWGIAMTKNNKVFNKYFRF